MCFDRYQSTASMVHDGHSTARSHPATGFHVASVHSIDDPTAMSGLRKVCEQYPSRSTVCQRLHEKRIELRYLLNTTPGSSLSTRHPLSTDEITATTVTVTAVVAMFQ